MRRTPVVRALLLQRSQFLENAQADRDIALVFATLYTSSGSIEDQLGYLREMNEHLRRSKAKMHLAECRTESAVGEINPS
ncbi:hypothetical protein LCGC14_1040360 [marine sediment metagenome]|uniref:Uncharacterized protein n=1 Tax=marine sediment metagenome TaxID=412755 RepID=A0A0F9NDL4_9ZZZZ